MKKSMQHALVALALGVVLSTLPATATEVEFAAGEGYADGDLTNNATWC